MTTSPLLLRAAIVLDHPAQHFAGGYTRLADEADLDVEVMYSDLHAGGHFDPSFERQVRWDVDLTSGYRHWSPGSTTTAGRALASARRLLQRRPEVILCYGWSTPIARVAIAVAMVCRIPILFYGDSTWQHSGRPRLRKIRSVILRRLFTPRTSFALSTGAFNRDFYLVNGMAPDHVYDGVCPVETGPFVAAAEARGRTPTSIDQPSVNSKAVRIAFAGKFIDRKAPGDIIEAATLLPADDSWQLIMIGDGPLRAQVEQRAHELGLGDRVTFSGFKNTSEMPGLLAEIDILVIPSTRDLRVLVATEAMAAGAVPVVSSATAVWGAGDLVEHGETGFVYPSGDTAALAAVLSGLLADAEARVRMSASAAKRALDHDSDDFARLCATAMRSVGRPTADRVRPRRAVISTKVAVAHAVTHPTVGRVLSRLTRGSAFVHGARIDMSSPFIADSTRAKLVLGLYERAEIRFIDKHLRHDLDVVELGCSIGVVGSVVLRNLDHDRRFIGVEADADLADIARRNLATNAGAIQWALETMAISYGPGGAFVKGEASTGGRLTSAVRPDEDVIARQTLSGLLSQHGVGRYTLIADIEGAEAGIINDDAAALARCDQIIIELHDTASLRVADLRQALVERHAFRVTAERGPVLVLQR